MCFHLDVFHRFLFETILMFIALHVSIRHTLDIMHERHRAFRVCFKTLNIRHVKFQVFVRVFVVLIEKKCGYFPNLISKEHFISKSVTILL